MWHGERDIRQWRIFSRQFKAVTGLTPTQYIASGIREESRRGVTEYCKRFGESCNTPPACGCVFLCTSLTKYTVMDSTIFLISLVTIVNEMSPYVLLGFLIAGLLHVFCSGVGHGRHLSGRGLKPVVKAAILAFRCLSFLRSSACGGLSAATGSSRAHRHRSLSLRRRQVWTPLQATYSLLGLPMP